ncbi:hypothetical protein DC522_14230 [Microvirga sp. KLBC 81]|nr:hypothetical protein DC522_14230 [Microvirga sp. KLBC 81]
MIYHRTGNLRAVQLLLGDTKIESTVEYIGIDVDDAPVIAEQFGVKTSAAAIDQAASPADPTSHHKANDRRVT